MDKDDVGFRNVSLTTARELISRYGVVHVATSVVGLSLYADVSRSEVLRLIDLAIVMLGGETNVSVFQTKESIYIEREMK